MFCSDSAKEIEVYLSKYMRKKNCLEQMRLILMSSWTL